VRLVEHDRLQSYLAPSLVSHLEAVVRGERPETPKPDNPAFQRVAWEVILGNRSARDCAAARARDMGLAPVEVVDTAIQDDAAVTGRRLIDELMKFRDAGLRYRDDRAAAGCIVWGGETTVHLDAKSPAGGRCQELALAAAGALDALGDRGHGIALVAAGTDGRDGPTDAAGAIVTADTWRAIASTSRDPARDLAKHEAHAALESAGALLPSKLTGTNVGDVVIGLVRKQGET
jgi:glycerate-2-kinase